MRARTEISKAQWVSGRSDQRILCCSVKTDFGQAEQQGPAGAAFPVLQHSMGCDLQLRSGDASEVGGERPSSLTLACTSVPWDCS